MNKCAIIILCDGVKNEAVAQLIVESIGSILTKNGCHGTINVKDEEGIIDALLCEEVRANKVAIEQQPDASEKEVLCAAISYIAKNFSTVLEEAKTSHDYTKFAVMLAIAIERDSNLQDSMKVIANYAGKIPSRYVTKYNFTEGAARAVRVVIGM